MALNQKETWQIEYLNEDGGVTKLVCVVIYFFFNLSDFLVFIGNILP